MGHENGGWMNEDQRDAVRALAESRPRDIHGEPVEMGAWYWMMNQLGQIVGTGKFAATIGWGEILFYINGFAGYRPEYKKFVRAEDPDQLFMLAKGEKPA
jgi:hypothetical protein